MTDIKKDELNLDATTSSETSKAESTSSEEPRKGFLGLGGSKVDKTKDKIKEQAEEIAELKAALKVETKAKEKALKKPNNQDISNAIKQSATGLAAKEEEKYNNAVLGKDLTEIVWDDALNARHPNGFEININTTSYTFGKDFICYKRHKKLADKLKEAYKGDVVKLPIMLANLKKLLKGKTYVLNEHLDNILPFLGKGTTKNVIAKEVLAMEIQANVREFKEDVSFDPSKFDTSTEKGLFEALGAAKALFNKEQK